MKCLWSIHIDDLLFNFSPSTGKRGLRFPFIYLSYSQLSMLGWFIYFIKAFKTGSLTWIANGWEFLYSAMLRLLTIFERKYWKFFHFIQFGRFKPELFFQWCWFCQKEMVSLFSNFLSRSLLGSFVLSFISFESPVS